MEEGLHLAQSEEGRFVGCGFGEVHDHTHVRTDILALRIDALSFVFGHPRSALLALARVEIGIEHGEIGTIPVEHFVGLDIGVVNGYILILAEGDAIETSGESEDALDDVGEFEIRSQHLGVDIILLELELMGIERCIPRHKAEIVALHLLSLGTEFVALLDGRRFIGVDELIEQVIDILGGAGHAFLEYVVGIGLIAKELSHLATQIDESLAYLEIVG
jgi:hypothetical protein